VSQRYHAGLVEHEFKAFLNDKTNWRSMLKNQYSEQDLLQVFDETWPQVEARLSPQLLEDITSVAARQDPVNIHYPALAYPDKIVSYNLDKNPLIEDSLMAIKGQYLIFNHGVINIRKYAGYDVTLEVV
jgi:hypothetical protein